jgi:hypothetical protein
MPLPKGISVTQALDRRTEVYIAVINSASKHGLEKGEVPEIANKIWDKIIEPLLEEKK